MGRINVILKYPNSTLEHFFVNVVFDQFFLSSIVGTNHPFSQSQAEKAIGKVGGQQAQTNETTGDITQLTESQLSHWGKELPNETQLTISSPTPANTLASTHNQEKIETRKDSSTLDDEIYDSDSSSVDDSNEVGTHMGSQTIDGVRKSTQVRNKKSENASFVDIADMELEKLERILQTFGENEAVFTTLTEAAKEIDVPLDQYLPEPQSLDEIMRLPPQIQRDWLAACKKEFKFIIENETLDGGEQELQVGDEVIPCMLIFKAKVTSRGFLDKLKARCVACGDLQVKSNDPEHLWSPCVFSRTFKMFVAEAVKRGRPIRQLDFIGAFCQAYMKSRLFLQLPKEFAFLLPEYAKYFEKPRLLNKSLYGTDVAAKVWNQDLTEWLTTNTIVPFHQSEVDPSLFVHRNGEEYIFMVIYVDDSLYFGSTKELEEKFTTAMSKCFKLELQG